MLTSALSFLSALRLSISQWALLSLSLVVGGLLALLKLKGTQLHQAQIDLLKFTIASSEEKNEAAVVKAKEVLKKAVKEYYDKR